MTNADERFTLNASQQISSLVYTSSGDLITASGWLYTIKKSLTDGQYSGWQRQAISFGLVESDKGYPGSRE